MNVYLLQIDSACMNVLLYVFFFFKQKTAYEMRISDWSSDVCSSDLKGLITAILNLANVTNQILLGLIVIRTTTTTTATRPIRIRGVVQVQRIDRKSVV